MKVRATRLGYYDLRRRKIGEVFDIKSEKQFSENWMEKVESKGGKSESKEPKETKKRGRPPKAEKSGKATGDKKVI